MKTLTSVAIATVGLALSASLAPAHAFSLTRSPACEAGGITGYTECSGSYELGRGENDVTNGGADNIATRLLNEDDLFGSADWTFQAKDDGSVTGDNEGGLTVTGLDETSGTLDFSNIDFATTDLAISLKAATDFSIYYIEAGSITDLSEITWNTAGTSTNRNGRARGLSHISYYTRIAELPGSPVRPVPEPAALSALFAIGAATVLRRQQSDKA